MKTNEHLELAIYNFHHFIDSPYHTVKKNPTLLKLITMTLAVHQHNPTPVLQLLVSHYNIPPYLQLSVIFNPSKIQPKSQNTRPQLKTPSKC